ncbi:MAG: adenylate kinase family enzyme [Ascidiaceihabitans sp.]|jgi:adenylate kinase family enzyme
MSTSLTSPVVLIGPEGAGKTTVAKLLSKMLGVPKMSMYDACWPYFRADKTFYRSEQSALADAGLSKPPQGLDELAAHYFRVLSCIKNQQ